jgi:predicted MFS family arabinose efflux permease
VKPRDVAFYAQPFLINFSWGVLSIGIPYYAGHLGASIKVIGALAGANALAYAFATLISGRLSDKFGCKPVAFCGALLFALSLVWMGLSSSIASLFWAAISAAWFTAFFWPAFHHWVGVRKSPRPLYSRIQTLCVSLATGNICGPILAGRAYLLNPRAPLFIAASIAALVCVAMLFEPSPDRSHRAAEIHFDPKIPERRKTLFLWLSRIGVCAAMFSEVCFRTFMPEFGRTIGQMTPDTVGDVITFGGIMFPLGLYWLGRHNNWHYSLRFLAVAAGLGIAGLSLMLFASSPLPALLSYGLFRASFAVMFFSSLYYSLARNEGQGNASAIHEFLLGAGAFAGPLIGGFTAELYGLRAPYAASLMFLLLLLIPQAALLWRYRKANGQGRMSKADDHADLP